MRDRILGRTLGLFVVGVLLGSPVALARTVWYVDDDAPNDPGPGDPTIGDSLEDGSWEHPYDAIQEAVDAASLGDEVIVLDGVYTGAGNKRIFHKEGVYLRSQHGPQSCIVDLEGIGVGFYFIRHETHDAQLEGFTIQNGEKGIHCSHSSPAIRRCVIRGHVVEGFYGGGINCWQSGPTISHCLIEGNIAVDSRGGGINVYNDGGYQVTIENCIISNNVAAEEGGGIYARSDDEVTIRDCLIIDNVAVGEGGGVYCRSVYNGEAVTIRQCTIVGNAAVTGDYLDQSYGGGVGVWGPNFQPRSICNCILWGNSATDDPQISVAWSSPPELVAYCNIQDDQPLGPAFYEIITDDPLLVDPANGDFHLSGGSPCFNAGDPDFQPAIDETDIDEQERVYDGRVDIGADEYYPFTDCNHNEIPDDEDIAGGTSPDCNGNQIPDDCELGDCNDNDVLDECDIASGESLDCNLNGIPDECERDCNGNGIPDECDIAEGTSLDENGNGVPDECDYVPCVMYVDDDAPGDPGPGDPEVSDPDEDGSLDHPFDALQEAIDAGNSRDEIVVLDGFYAGMGNRDIDFGGRRIYLHSLGEPEYCVIDCEGSGIGFRFHLYETPEARLEGLTIQNGWSEYDAAGIECWDSSPTIHNCVITENVSVYYGAICLSRSDALISNCRITYNDGSISGYGGITCASGSAPSIRDCVIAGNLSTWHGGIGCYHDSRPTITNCTIHDNSARYNSGGIACHGSSPILRNCILWGNDAPSNLEIHLEGGSYPVVDFCAMDAELPAAVTDGGHNIYLDPSLLDFPTGHLADGSPCIDAGDPNFVPADGETDIDGQARVLNGRVDIGADEYDPSDCNNNGAPDDQDIADGISQDCDGDGVPDECQLGGTLDCNQNGVPDLCDVFDGSSQDCNQNAIPDECEPGGDQDCDGDGVSDLCEIVQGSLDINVNDVPDECEPHVTVYVDDDGPNDPGPGDPSVSDPDENGTPDHPYDAIQEGLDAAPSGAEEIVVVLVADGLYNGLGNRDLDFGGKILTLRSESGPDSCIIDCQQAGRGFYFHTDETPASVLHGFTIRNGVGDWGGGIYCAGGTPTISDCTIADCVATDWASEGGGIYCWSHSNHAQLIRNCSITGNTSEMEGGGISCGSGTCIIRNCLIAGNQCVDASGGGGGVFGRHFSIVHIQNSLITGNACYEEHGDNNSYGGGVTGGGCMLTIDNCTVTRNLAGTRGGHGVYSKHDCNTVIRNSIIRDNLPGGSEIAFQLTDEPAPPIVAYCNIGGGLPPGMIDGGGNIDLDPFFVDADGPDADPNTWQDNDYHVSGPSPSIDAGNNYLVPASLTTDLDRRLRFADRIGTSDTGIGIPPLVDMGAYEYQCTGDLDGDGDGDFDDLLILLGNYGQTGMTYEDGDLDGDGDVDLADLATLLGSYGTICE